MEKNESEVEEQKGEDRTTSRKILFLALDSFVETVGCRAKRTFVVTLRLNFVVVVDGRSYKVPDQALIHPTHIEPDPVAVIRIHSQTVCKAKKTEEIILTNRLKLVNS